MHVGTGGTGEGEHRRQGVRIGAVRRVPEMPAATIGEGIKALSAVRAIAASTRARVKEGRRAGAIVAPEVAAVEVAAVAAAAAVGKTTRTVSCTFPDIHGGPCDESPEIPEG